MWRHLCAWTTVMSTRCKQNVSPAANKQSCSLRLQRCNRAADSPIPVFAQFPVMCAWQQTTPRSIPGLAKLPGKTEAYTSWKAWAWLRLTQLLMNGSSKEYAWLAYDWMKRMSCFAVRVMGLLTVEWRLNCVELNCNAVLDVCRIG